MHLKDFSNITGAFQDPQSDEESEDKEEGDEDGVVGGDDGEGGDEDGEGGGDNGAGLIGGVHAEDTFSDADNKEEAHSFVANGDLCDNNYDDCGDAHDVDDDRGGDIGDVNAEYCKVEAQICDSAKVTTFLKACKCQDQRRRPEFGRGGGGEKKYEKN